MLRSSSDLSPTNKGFQRRPYSPPERYHVSGGVEQERDRAPKSMKKVEELGRSQGQEQGRYIHSHRHARDEAGEGDLRQYTGGAAEAGAYLNVS